MHRLHARPRLPDAARATWRPRAAQDMGSVSGRWIAAAMVPALLITILFFFDHNVSAQLAQQASPRLPGHW